jgi:hypothetical protein
MRKSYPDCDATHALELLNLAVRNLCRHMPLYRNSATISLTADTQEYTLGDTVNQIQNVYYETSATQRKELEYRPLDELNQEDGSWRYRSSSTPSYYYITQTASSAPAGALKIGFDPTPDTTTDGTYPRVKYYFSETPTSDFITTDSSPQLLERPDVIIYEACRLYAMEERLWEDVQAWQALYEKELSRQWGHVNHRVQYKPPRFESKRFSRIPSKI